MENSLSAGLLSAESVSGGHGIIVSNAKFPDYVNIENMA
jgi:hypothetical protein